MIAGSPLRPADPACIADALAYALLYDGNRRVHHADGIMAHITAERLIQHLARAGFVLMRQEPATAPTKIQIYEIAQIQISGLACSRIDGYPDFHTSGNSDRQTNGFPSMRIST